MSAAEKPSAQDIKSAKLRLPVTTVLGVAHSQLNEDDSTATIVGRPVTAISVFHWTWIAFRQQGSITYRLLFSELLDGLSLLEFSKMP